MIIWWDGSAFYTSWQSHIDTAKVIKVTCNPRQDRLTDAVRGGQSRRLKSSRKLRFDLHGREVDWLAANIDTLIVRMYEDVMQFLYQ